MNSEVKSSLYSARGCYFVCYTLGFIAIYMYDNDLRKAIIRHDVWDVLYVIRYIALLVVSTVFFMITGSNCGFLSDYPQADIVQGRDYQTGYFVNGKHVTDRQSIKAVHDDKQSMETEIFERADTENQM